MDNMFFYNFFIYWWILTNLVSKWPWERVLDENSLIILFGFTLTCVRTSKLNPHNYLFCAWPHICGFTLYCDSEYIFIFFWSLDWFMSKKTFVVCFNLKAINCSSNDPQYNRYHNYKKNCQWYNFKKWTWYKTTVMTLFSTSLTLKMRKNLCNSRLYKFQIFHVYLPTYLAVAILIF